MKKRLLLHVCCAPCSTHPANLLKNGFDVTLLFYNTNIHPHDEYNKRLNEAIRFSRIVGIPLIEFKDDDKQWFDKVKGHEHDKEGGDRCSICFRHRLDKTAEIAKKKGFDIFTTTLTVSPYKSSRKVNLIGKELEEKFDVKFMESDFKKQDGYKESIELSKKHGIYRQHYCGCTYSKR